MKIMKKIVLMIGILGLVAFGMASCERDDDNGGTGNGNTPTNPTDTTSTPTNPTNPTDTTSTPTDTTATPVPEGYVDLGLPSGLLWAKCNLGATTPEGYGNYYAWGETQPKSEYTWATYTYGDTTYHLYKYNTSADYGTVDNKTTLEAADDAATVVLGGGARMPTSDDWVELRSNTTGEWTQQNGVNGWKFTATNGNSLFLPAAGRRCGSSLYDGGTYGFYWSSSLLTDDPSRVRNFYFHSDGSRMNSFNRNYGFSVRAVRSQN